MPLSQFPDWIGTVVTVAVATVSGIFGAIKLYVKPMATTLDRVVSDVSKQDTRQVELETKVLGIGLIQKQNQEMWRESLASFRDTSERLHAALEKLSDRTDTKMETLDTRTQTIERRIVEVLTVLNRDSSNG
jgi:gas vesicle protein